MPSPSADLSRLAVLRSRARVHVDIKGKVDPLFREGAVLYVAKRAGRNGVELLGPHDACELAELKVMVRGAARSPRPEATPSS